MKVMPLLALMRERFPEQSKETLYSAILCREVSVNGSIISDPKLMVNKQVDIKLQRKQFVSRGGLKLQHALETWKLRVDGKRYLDAGSSTGGFTDCLLQAGASRVYAVDVGYNQLDYKLRTDARVTVMERTNIMHVEAADVEPQPHAAVADLSFRSIHGAAGKVLSLTSEGWMIALIKPQFETDAVSDTFTGVVTDRDMLINILRETFLLLKDENVLVSALVESPITGRKGNREFLALLVDAQQVPGDFTLIEDDELNEMIPRIVSEGRIIP